MAYTKQTWECGDTITAEKLNHMEDGIASSGSEPLIVRVDHEETVDDVTRVYYDKTWQEVKDAYDAGRPVYLYDDDLGIRQYLGGVDTLHSARARFFSGQFGVLLSADSTDGYLYSESRSGGGQPSES